MNILKWLPATKRDIHRMECRILDAFRWHSDEAAVLVALTRKLRASNQALKQTVRCHQEILSG